MKRGRKKNCACCDRRTCSRVQCTVGRGRARPCSRAVAWRGVAFVYPAGHSADPCRGDRRKQRLGVGLPRRALPRLLSPSCHAVPLAARPSYPSIPLAVRCSRSRCQREAHAVRQSAPRAASGTSYLFLSRVRSGRQPHRDVQWLHRSPSDRWYCV